MNNVFDPGEETVFFPGDDSDLKNEAIAENKSRSNDGFHEPKFRRNQTLVKEDK